MKVVKCSSARRRCIVIESGAGLVRPPDCGGFEETTVVAQAPGELPGRFLVRVMERLSGIERSGRYFESIVFSVGSARHTSTSAVRRLLVLGLSAHARVFGARPELLLRAAADADGALRTELLGLAGEVVEAPGGPLAVQLRFTEAAEPDTRPLRHALQRDDAPVLAANAQ